MRRPESISSIVGGVAEDLGLGEQLRFRRLLDLWGSYFPGSLSLHVRPSSIKGGVLSLTADSPGWVQEITFSKKEILAKLSANGVKDIKVRVGRINIKLNGREADTAAVNEAKQPLDKEESAMVESAVGRLQDGELSETFRRIFSRSLRLEAKKRQEP